MKFAPVTATRPHDPRITLRKELYLLWIIGHSAIPD
jgi:hypothetical protein